MNESTKNSTLLHVKQTTMLRENPLRLFREIEILQQTHKHNA